jgi:D-alanyl-D-alanine carboxypeptidase
MEKSESTSNFISKKRIYIVIVFLLMLFTGYVVWNEYNNRIYLQKIEALQSAYDKYTSDLEILRASSTASSDSFNELYKTLSYVIEEEKLKNRTLEEKLGIVSSTVGSLDKLSKVDPQLLKKYSKVYFLNENYIPVSLTTVPTEYTYNTQTSYQIHSDVIFFLQTMMDAAKKEDVNLLIISAYRSFATQGDLKAINKVKYGAKTANQFSAEQGFSEHQLGTTVDFTTSQTGTNFIKFDGTKEYQWLKNHAHKYGFILSYPKGNVYYAYEPWHWRFVGVALATRLYEEAKYFYDYDQRTIDIFQTSIFDRF